MTMKNRIHEACIPHDITRRGMLRAAVWGAVALGTWGTRVRAEGAPQATLSTDITGDETLANALRPHLARSRRVAVALIEPGQPPRFAGFGADENTEFEIGSVTKPLTGALLTDAVNSGVLTLETTVQDILGERAAGSAIADVRMVELATHTCGLPNFPEDVAARMATVANPLGPYSPGDVVRTALQSPVSGRGKISYCSLGVALMGHLVAFAQGRSWRDLLAERVLGPLGLHRTWSPGTEGELYARTGGHPTTGTDANGNPVPPWACTGYAPAGMLRSNAADLACYLEQLIRAPNPAAAGLEPLVRDASGQTGYAINWQVDFRDFADDPVYSHGGATAGFSAICAFQRKSGRGVVVLDATAGKRDELQGIVKLVMGGGIAG